MKKYLGMLAVLLAFSPLAQAQVYFDSGSARPNNAPNVQRERRNAKPMRHGVRCRDGSISYARKNVCRGHRGVRR